MREENAENYKIDEKLSEKLKILSFCLSIIIVARHATLVSYDEKLMLQVQEMNSRGGIACCAKLLQLYFFGGISNIAVPMFFVISGFLYYRDADKTNIGKKIEKRYKSLFIPYVIWNTLGWIYFAVIMNIPIISAHMNSKPLQISMKSFFVDFVDPILPLWFVRDLMMITIISPIILVVSNKKKMLIFTNVILLGLMCILPEAKHSIVYSIFYYLFGVAAVKYLNSYITLKRNLVIQILIFVPLSVFTFVINTYWHVPIAIKNIVLVCLCISFWYSIGEIFIKIKFRKFMELSFFIYCSHSFFVTVIKKVAIMLIGQNAILIFVGWPLTVVLSLACVYLAAMIIRKISPQFYGLLSGGR